MLRITMVLIRGLGWRRASERCEVFGGRGNAENYGGIRG